MLKLKVRMFDIVWDTTGEDEMYDDEGNRVYLQPTALASTFYVQDMVMWDRDHDKLIRETLSEEIGSPVEEFKFEILDSKEYPEDFYRPYRTEKMSHE